MYNEENSVTVLREIPAPSSVVFAGWTDPAVLGSWLIPEGCTITAAETDPRAGGHYRFVFLVPDGSGSQGLAGKYREFIQDKRIVKTWILGNEGEDVAAASVKLLTADFDEASPGVTTLQVTHQGENNPEIRGHLKEILNQCLAKLGAWAEAQK